MKPDMYADYEQLAEDVRTMQRRMAGIRATAESADGLISATVGGAGELLELSLDPRIYRTADSVALAKDITDTIHEAVESSTEQGLAIAAGFLPPGMDADAVDLRFDPVLRRLERPERGYGR